MQDTEVIVMKLRRKQGMSVYSAMSLGDESWRLVIYSVHTSHDV